jgi:hypothetical protein
MLPGNNAHGSPVAAAVLHLCLNPCRAYACRATGLSHGSYPDACQSITRGPMAALSRHQIHRVFRYLALGDRIKNPTLCGEAVNIFLSMIYIVTFSRKPCWFLAGEFSSKIRNRTIHHYHFGKESFLSFKGCPPAPAVQ